MFVTVKSYCITKANMVVRFAYDVISDSRDILMQEFGNYDEVKAKL